MSLSTAQMQSIIVIFGVSGIDKNTLIDLLNRRAPDAFTHENIQIQGDVLLGKMKSIEEAKKASSKLSGMLINAKRATVLSLDRVHALSRIGEKGKTALAASKPAVKKLSGKKEIDQWKQEIDGEQFLIYNEGVLTNYQLSKLFSCKATRSKPLPNSKLLVEEDLVLIQRQKNIFIYGGTLDLLDGHVEDAVIKYFTKGTIFFICTRVDEETHKWEGYDIYTKNLFLRLELSSEGSFYISRKCTHYAVEDKGEVKMFSAALNELVYQNHLELREHEKVEVSFSPLDNVVLFSRNTSVGIRFVLCCLDTGETLRTKVFANVLDYSVEYLQDEVSIIYKRKTGTKITTYIDIWTISDNSVIAKALGEDVQRVHLASEMLVLSFSAYIKVLSRTKNRLTEARVIKGSFECIAPGRVTAVLGEDRLMLLDKNGVSLRELPMQSVDRIEWSPFGLFLALIDAGQVHILDLCGKEIFVSNITGDDAFFWRRAISPVSKDMLSQEDILRYKEEDTRRKQESKKQLIEENKDLIREWKAFLTEMKSMFYASVSAN
ncbi:hypothetical protein NEFER03_0839 [Nematocida sp. LUAm3]|nr:hypothetical protein NEFER03_0839 [Nematocida sp. LUAm3]KAI5174857.1 hypothetical protein NEFER02_0957 [Nematocida sp. LUAm2]KAI5177545.1 hypothetical protein NEFER01_0795 [Nematocida sp. LUAm1]